MVMKDSFAQDLFNTAWMISLAGPNFLYWVGMSGALTDSMNDNIFMSPYVWPWFFGICFFNVMQMFVSKILSIGIATPTDQGNNCNNL